MYRLALAIAFILACLAPCALHAQDHQHTPGMTHGAPATPAAAASLPAQAGQDAYAAVAEIVRLLQADSTTDWSRVNLEALRQHLIDMNAVTLGARVTQAEIAGGMQADVTGDGQTAEAIRRMLGEHATMLSRSGDYVVRVTPIAGGARFAVTSPQPADAGAVARIRGLGFIGLMTVGAHHAEHHLALARGGSMSHEH